MFYAVLLVSDASMESVPVWSLMMTVMLLYRSRKPKAKK